MDSDERRRIEAAMATISLEKKAVQADPPAAMKASLDASMAKVKRRLLHILFWVALAAVTAIAIYWRGHQ